MRIIIAFLLAVILGLSYKLYSLMPGEVVSSGDKLEIKSEIAADENAFSPPDENDLDKDRNYKEFVVRCMKVAKTSFCKGRSFRQGRNGFGVCVLEHSEELREHCSELEKSLLNVMENFCGPDIEKYCSEDKTRSSQIGCLAENRGKVSMKCWLEFGQELLH